MLRVHSSLDPMPVRKVESDVAVASPHKDRLYSCNGEFDHGQTSLIRTLDLRYR